MATDDELNQGGGAGAIGMEAWGAASMNAPSGWDYSGSESDQLKNSILSPTALRSGVNVGNAIAVIATAGAAATGPVGVGVAATVDIAINGYQGYKDIGVMQGQISTLESLKKIHGAHEDSKKILEWQINKFKRRTRYDHAESGGAHYYKGAVKGGANKASAIDHTSKTGKLKKGAAYAAGATGAAVGGVGVAAGAGVGQAGSKLTRMGRGALKKVGLMGSKRSGYANRLYELAVREGCPLAKNMIELMLNKQKSGDMQKKIDDIIKKELSKAMSSFKGT